MIAAVIDISSAQELLQALPEGTDVKSRGGLYYASYGGYQLFARRIFSNQSRWIAIAVGPGKVLAWLQSRLDSARVRELTRSLYLANQAQFEAVGFSPETVDGRLVLRLPHVICGQSPFVELG